MPSTRGRNSLESSQKTAGRSVDAKDVTAMIRILIADDFKPFRIFVTSLLSANGYVLCEASDGLEALGKAQEMPPDLILLDIGLPKLNGLDVARRLRELVPSSKIVFFTQENSAEVVQEALDLGAWGYVAKSRARADLLAALTTALQGRRFVSSGLRHDRLRRAWQGHVA